MRPPSSKELPGGLIRCDVAFVRGDDMLVVTCISGRTTDLRLRVINVQATTGPPLNGVLKARAAGVAVNGGFFDAGRVPVGLLKIDGKTVAAVSDRPLLSAVVVGGPDEPPRIVARNAVPADAADARQCGPSLVGPRDTAGNRTAVAERSIVLMSGDRFGVAIATSTTLDDLADVLAQHAPALGMPGLTQAVNLDGGPSTGLLVIDHDTPDGFEPRGSISDALVLGPK